MVVTVINKKEEFDEAIKGEKLVVIDFHAVWCGPCKAISPVLEKHSDSNTFADKANFYKIDVDELQQLAADLGVTAMPTFLFYKGGEILDKVIGANQHALKAALEKNV